jgi:hypothetical protein
MTIYVTQGKRLLKGPTSAKSRRINIFHFGCMGDCVQFVQELQAGIEGMISVFMQMRWQYVKAPPCSVSRWSFA